MTDSTIEQGYFTEEDSAEVVISRNASAPSERLKTVMASLTTHLHAFIKDVEPTHEEWMAGIEFLTQTGHMCSEWRQEFILLSDVLGVSMLVETINGRRPSGATEETVLGPFHVAGAPHRAIGDNICLDGKGEAMVVTGRVTDTEGHPVSGAMLDVWQANDEGFYDVQQKGIQPDWNLRGIFTTDADGRYWFRSVKPRFYAIPHDGPVGQMLQALGRHPYRPAHIHYIVAAKGFEPITTHIFVPGDPYLHSDAVFGVKESLIREFTLNENPDDAARFNIEFPFWHADCSFVLAPAGGEISRSSHVNDKDET